MNKKILYVSVALGGLLFLPFQNCSPVSFEQKTDGSNSAERFDNAPVCRELDADEVKPKLKWDWYASLDKSAVENYASFSQVMSTPMVADLNGDGIPEVVFTSFSVTAADWYDDTAPTTSSYGRNGVLRIVDGKTGRNIKSIAGKSLSPYGTTSPLLVDLDGDGKIEIIYSHYLGRKVIALNHDGSTRWVYDVTGNSVYNISSLSSADFNKDGRADVILSSEVITEVSGVPQKMFNINGGTTSYQFAYALNPSTPSVQQIIGRSGVFNSSGAKLFNLDNVLMYAAADINAENAGLEIIGTGNGFLKVYNGLNGSVIKSVDLKSVGGLECAYRKPDGTFSTRIGGGPPTIGDFDGNPNTSEIAVATGKFLSIFDQNANLINKYETQDCSSLATGISSFDFNGDGQPEILYADEEYLRVFELHQGQLRVIAQIVNPSGTLYEYPVVVDVDGNGSSEVVVASNNYAVASFYGDPAEVNDKAEAFKTTGVRAFEANVEGSWMPTRPIWNQFEYNPSMFTDRGVASVVAPAPTAYTNKTFRRNSQLGLFEPTCK